MWALGQPQAAVTSHSLPAPPSPQPGVQLSPGKGGRDAFVSRTNTPPSEQVGPQDGPWRLPGGGVFHQVRPRLWRISGGVSRDVVKDRLWAAGDKCLLKLT